MTTSLEEGEKYVVNLRPAKGGLKEFWLENVKITEQLLMTKKPQMSSQTPLRKSLRKST